MTGFEALDVAHEAVRGMFELFEGTSNTFKGMVEQGRRSGPSVVLNLAEGHGRTGRDRAYHFRVAYASSQETSAVLRLLRDVKALPDKRVAPVLELFDRVQAMTWRLAQRRS